MSGMDICSPDLDPNDYKIEELMRVLTQYDVDFPPKRQKKQFYVDLFNEHLAYMQKRKKSELKLARDAEFVVPTTPASAKKRSTRQASATKPTPAKENPTPVSTTPVLAFKKRAVMMESDTESMFSDENPFQAGSQKKEKVHRKKHFVPANIPMDSPLSSINVDFADSDVVFDKKSSPKSKAPTPKQAESAKNSPASTRSKKTRTKSVTLNPTPIRIEYSPESTPSPVEPAEVPKKKTLYERLLERKQAEQRKQIPFKILMSIIGLLGLITAHWYAVDHPKLAYCSDDSNPQMLYNFLPNCIDCPPNSICTDKQVVGCVSTDYRLKRNPITLFLPDFLLIFPLGQPYCILDPNRMLTESKKAKQTEHLINVVDEIVREYVGELECHRSAVSADMKWVFSVKPPHQPLGIPVNLAKAELKKLVESKWDETIFEEYWAMLLDSVFQPNDKIPLYSVIDDTYFRHRLFGSKNSPITSFSCRMQQKIWKFAKDYTLELVLAGVIVLAGIYINQVFAQKEYESKVAAILLEDVLEVIHEEYQAHQNDGAHHPFPGLPVVQLRDHFLPPFKNRNKKDQGVDNSGRCIWFVPDDSTRKSIWTKLRTEILKNSNIRETNVQIKGEAQIIWMWIGSTILSPLKRRTDFTVYGGTANQSPVANQSND